MSRGSILSSMGAIAVFGMATLASAAGLAPRAFAPDVVSAPDGVDCLTFTPDGNTLFFDREGAHGSTIMTSRRVDGRWWAPTVAPFSGLWVDHDPVVAPDGSYMIFTSNRPAVAGGKPLRGGQLWRVDRDGGWAAPVRLPVVVNFGTHIYAPSVAANGDVYFQSDDNPAHRFHIYRATWRSGGFQKPVQLQIAPAGAYEQDPAVAPDGSFIVFDYGYAATHQPQRLYIAYRRGDDWSPPVDLGDTVNHLQPWGAHLGPDGHTLYVTSDVTLGTGDGHVNHIWSLELAAWLPARGKTAADPAGTPGVATAAQPRVFAPGVVSGPANDAAATFSPDGRTVYFFRSNGQDYDIMTSRFDGARWSQPVIASFSGHWRDLEPAMAPDGSYLIFASSRPIDGSGRPIDGHWGGQLHPGRGGHLWRVNRQGDGWSAPTLLPDTVNRFDSTFSPAIAADGSVYFMAATGPGGHFQLYCSQLKDGEYRTPELLSFSAGQYGGVDPALAPDQSFIVFGSNRPPTPEHESYAFIAFRAHGRWGQPIPLPPAVNDLGGIDELRLGPDGHTLYVTSNHVVPPDSPKTDGSSLTGLQQMQSWNDGQDNIWMFDLGPWLAQTGRRGSRELE